MRRNNSKHFQFIFGLTGATIAVASLLSSTVVRAQQPGRQNDAETPRSNRRPRQQNASEDPNITRARCALFQAHPLHCAARQLMAIVPTANILRNQSSVLPLMGTACEQAYGQLGILQQGALMLAGRSVKEAWESADATRDPDPASLELFNTCAHSAARETDLRRINQLVAILTQGMSSGDRARVARLYNELRTFNGERRVAFDAASGRLVFEQPVAVAAAGSTDPAQGAAVPGANAAARPEPIPVRLPQLAVERAVVTAGQTAGQSIAVALASPTGQAALNAANVSATERTQMANLAAALQQFQNPEVRANVVGALLDRYPQLNYQDRVSLLGVAYNPYLVHEMQRNSEYRERTVLALQRLGGGHSQR